MTAYPPTIIFTMAPTTTTTEAEAAVAAVDWTNEGTNRTERETTHLSLAMSDVVHRTVGRGSGGGGDAEFARSLA